MQTGEVMKNQILRTVPEILAPAGSWEAMEAAVNAGCDAVYLGGQLFSARAFAGNFGTEELVRAIDYCHLFGVKVYMTVNTLMKEPELLQLASYMAPFYEAGLDGVILQDMGVLRMLRECFPELPLHASTQMSISSACGARFLKSQGICRIVPSRELSLAEIRSIRQTADVEIETFVHGAMCYAYSGRCLFSSFLGGRSGNRGRCAQPCRKCYEVLDSRAGKGIAREYIMSLKDMCTLQILPRLMDAGIDSFKIEGRMKNPSYVAATVDAYRKARDYYRNFQESAFSVPAGEGAICGRFVGTEQSAKAVKQIRTTGGQPEKTDRMTWEELPAAAQQQYRELADRLICDMQDIYNRGGFYPGYYDTEKGLSMTAVKRPNHMGLRIGRIQSVKGPEIGIRLEKDVHAQDVLEIPDTGTELTSNQNGKTGGIIRLKGKDLKKLKEGMEVYRTRNNWLLQEIEEQILKPEKKLRAAAFVQARVNRPLQIVMGTSREACMKLRAELLNSAGRGFYRQEAAVCVCGSILQAASNQRTQEQTLLSHMQKTGGTHVQVEAECSMDPDVFVPMSEFNRLRREAVEKLKQAVAGQYHRKLPETAAVQEHGIASGQVPETAAGQEHGIASGQMPGTAARQYYRTMPETAAGKDDYDEESTAKCRISQTRNGREGMAGKTRQETAVTGPETAADKGTPDRTQQRNVETIYFRVRTMQQLRAVSGWIGKHINRNEISFRKTEETIQKDSGDSTEYRLSNKAGEHRIKFQPEVGSNTEYILLLDGDLKMLQELPPEVSKCRIFRCLPDVARESRFDLVREIAMSGSCGYCGPPVGESRGSFTEPVVSSCEPVYYNQEQKGLCDGREMVSACGLVIRNLDELSLLIELGYQGPVIGDAFLYACNTEAIRFYLEQFPKMQFLCSDELTDRELSAITDEGSDGSCRWIYKIYGHQQLMTSAQCISRNYTSCKEKMLCFRDEKGELFYALSDCSSCSSAVFYGKPTCMLDRQTEIPYRNLLVDFTVETAAQTERILQLLESASGGPTENSTGRGLKTGTGRPEKDNTGGKRTDSAEEGKSSLWFHGHHDRGID